MLDERLKSLALNLERMNVLYARAAGIIERERQALIIFDYEELYSLFKEKDEVLTAIRALDKDRLKVQDLYALLNKQSADQVSLYSMAQQMISSGGDKMSIGNRLLALRNTLAQTVENLRQKIELNRSFTEKSVSNLRHIAEHMSAMVQGRHASPADRRPGYTGRGKFTQTVGTTGGLLEKRL